MAHARLCLVLVAGLVCAAPAPVAAQPTYTLEGNTWQQTEAPAPGSPEGILQLARKEIAEGDGSAAEDILDDWLERYPNHPLAAEAYLLRGDAKTARKHYYDALFDYEYVLRTYPAAPQFTVALEREFEIARLFAAGMKRKFLGMRILPAREEAEEIFIRIQERAPGSEIGERASLALGDYYFARGEMASASEAYDIFLLNYPESPKREQVLLKLIQAQLATFKGPTFDARGLVDAAERLRMLQAEFPAAADKIGAEALLKRIDESLARKTFENARWYEKRGERVSAIHLYQRVVKDWPRTSVAQESLAKLQALGAPPVVVERQAATQPVE